MRRIDERRWNARIAGCLGELVKRTVVSALVGGVRRSIRRAGSLGEPANGNAIVTGGKRHTPQY